MENIFYYKNINLKLLFCLCDYKFIIRQANKELYHVQVTFRLFTIKLQDEESVRDKSKIKENQINRKFSSSPPPPKPPHLYITKGNSCMMYFTPA